jgi:hypothetical protein
MEIGLRRSKTKLQITDVVVAFLFARLLLELEISCNTAAKVVCSSCLNIVGQSLCIMDLVYGEYSKIYKVVLEYAKVMLKVFNNIL